MRSDIQVSLQSAMLKQRIPKLFFVSHGLSSQEIKEINPDLKAEKRNPASIKQVCGFFFLMRKASYEIVIGKAFHIKWLLKKQL